MLVAPSLLAADFACLRTDIEAINASNADYFHIDIMDGVFVPNISFGFPVIKAISRYARKPLDVHMMIVEPQKFIGAVKNTGAEFMTVHYEACTHLHRTVQEIHDAGMKAGVSLNPSTPVEALTDIIGDIDMVLIMSVNPGFGGQKFIEHSLDKIRRLRRMIESAGSKTLIEVDGGVNAVTAPRLAEAGTDMVVAGSFVFGNPDMSPDDAVNMLKSL